LITETLVPSKLGLHPDLAETMGDAEVPLREIRVKVIAVKKEGNIIIWKLEGEIVKDVK